MTSPSTAVSTSAAPPVAGPDPRRWRMLPVILTASFMALFDFFVTNVAATSIQSDLHTGTAELELIVGGYAFTYASGLVTGGRLGDRFGYRRLFMIGMAGFTLASLLCGLAQTSGELIGARLLQGLLAAAMVPQVLAMITAVFPPHERARAVSWFGVAVGLGGVAGQILGGYLLDIDLFGWGWRTIFLVNGPVGLVALILAGRLLPRRSGPANRRLDPVGAIGLSLSLALLLVPMVLGRGLGWPAWTFVSMAAAVPGLAAVLWWQRTLARRGGEPLMDLTLFRGRVFSAGLGVNFAFMAFFSSFMLALTLFLQAGLHLSPLESGLSFGPLGIISAVTSVAGGRLITRMGSRVITLGSLICLAGVIGVVGVVWASGDHVSVARLMGPMILVGFGSGLGFPALVGTVISGVHVRQAGGAAGILTTTQQFASATGVAVLGTIFFSALGTHPDRSDFVRALTLSGLLAAGLMAAASVLSVLLRPRPATESGGKSVEAAEEVA